MNEKGDPMTCRQPQISKNNGYLWGHVLYTCDLEERTVAGIKF